MDGVIAKKTECYIANANGTQITIEELYLHISDYGKKVSSTSRRSRKFLRNIGMIDSKGNIIKHK